MMNTSTTQPISPFHHQHPHQQQQQQQQQQELQQDTNGVSTQQGSSVSATSTNLRRGPWSPEEDRKLLDSINLFGATNWVRISQSIGTRIPKQCRERYHQNLKPSLNRNPISPEEGHLIEELVGKYGKRWAEIARHLNGRSDNAIKNWWNGGANRRRRASSQAILTETSHHHPNQQPIHHLQPVNDYNPQQQQQQQQQSHYSPSFNTQIFQQQQHQQQQPSQQGPSPPQQNQAPHQPITHHLAPPIYHQQSQTLPPLQQLPCTAAGPQQQQQQLQSSSSHQPLMLLSSMSQQQMLPPANTSRSVSMNQEIFQQQPGVKRFLEEQHIPIRRHSAQTIMTSATQASSSSPFSASPLSRGPSSRNSSISYDPTSHPPSSSGYFSEYSNNTSRRSSIAPDVFPNPFHYQAKRQNSATYLSPNFTPHRGSASGLPSSLSTLSYTPTNDSSQTEAPSPIFKSEFSFKANESSNNENTAPAPVSADENKDQKPRGVKDILNNDAPKKEDTEEEEGEEKKKVMDISNLLG